MISVPIDALAVGGLSLVAVVLLFVFLERPFEVAVPESLAYGLTVAVTWPHFLASYRLLYATKARALAHPVASIYLPLALAAVCAASVVAAPWTLAPARALTLVSGVYLARHYTGQTFGMMASYAFVSGISFSSRERFLLLSSMNVAMFWQISWALAGTVGLVVPSLETAVRAVDARVDPLAVLAFGLGAVALASLARRTGTSPPLRVVVPFLALFAWYALLRRDPTSLVVVQVSHALQYLAFPLRIHENEASGSPARLSPARATAFVASLALVGFAVFAGVPALFSYGFRSSGGVSDVASAFTSSFVAFVNIHHYFVDGSLYKLRNPEVRRSLFSHLAPRMA
ncbi:MAG TPA: hypothetical protein VHE30_09985 [Polyangiaceae bacterium]|nr:hypothetical protein [Polyangiaceae bacterium]